MKIWTWEESAESQESLSYYKGLGITKYDLYACADICKSHKDFMVVFWILMNMAMSERAYG